LAILFSPIILIGCFISYGEYGCQCRICDTIPLVIIPLQVIIAGRVKTTLYFYALPYGMRFRSSANFVGFVVSFLNVFSYTPAEPPPCRLNIIFDLVELV
jgi:hypothetical protein